MIRSDASAFERILEQACASMGRPQRLSSDRRGLSTRMSVLLEAMASGVPCVVTGCGNSRESVGDTGVFVRPRDPAALAQGIRDLLSLRPEARATRTHAAAQRVREKLDFGVMTRRCVVLCREATAARRLSVARAQSSRGDLLR